ARSAISIFRVISGQSPRHVGSSPSQPSIAQSALVLKQLQGGVEDLPRVGVALTLHLLHPFVPEWLSGKFGPARELGRWNDVAVDLVISRFGTLDHAFLGSVEEITPPELRSGNTADAHNGAAHFLGQRLPFSLVGAQREIRRHKTERWCSSSPAHKGGKPAPPPTGRLRRRPHLCRETDRRRASGSRSAPRPAPWPFQSAARPGRGISVP